MNQSNIFLKRGNFFWIFLIFVFFFSGPYVSSEVDTNMTILNAAPNFIGTIPNQTWSTNENLSNIFDLDDYFSDDNGDNLTFYSTSITNIDVIINSTTNEVSFFPDAGFSGSRSLTFLASDSIYNTSSNLVFLNVGVDTQAPKWFSPSKSKSTIYQNDYVNFSTSWTDDQSLYSFIFSIDQGSGWTNSSTTYFSGVENISTQRIQISATYSTSVSWKIYAFDSSGNSNVTAVQTFTIAEPETSEGEEGDDSDYEEGEGIISSILESVGILETRKTKDFKLDISDFILSLKQGESRTFVLKITNIGTEELLFNLSIEGLSDFIIFDETEFNILPGSSKEITIDFKTSKFESPGQYFGSIVVIADDIKKSIPVIVNVNALETEFDVDLEISPKYSVVKPGKILKTNVTITNIKDPVDTNATLYFALKDLSGNIYDSSEEEISFTTSLFLEKEFEIPSGIKEGKYLIYVRVSNEDSIAIDSESFEIGSKFKLAAFLKSGFIFISILILSIFLASMMIKMKRDRQKERILELYLMLNNLKKAVNQNKLDEALSLYVRIKTLYHEPIKEDIVRNKEKFKQEISSIAKIIDSQAKELNIVKPTGKQVVPLKKTPVVTPKKIVPPLQKRVLSTQPKKVLPSPKEIKKANPSINTNKKVPVKK